MNNVIKPNTSIKILSQDHLGYVKRLAHQQGFERYIHALPDIDTNWVSFYEDMTYTQSIGDHPYFEEIFIPIPKPSPTPPFKLRNANHPAVREWLKEMGYSFQSTILNLETTNLDHSFGIVNGDGCFFTLAGEEYFDQLDQFELEDYPELTLNLAVTSWSLPEPIDKAKLERMERIKAIEAELDKLKQMDV